jgi:hypothetical protein
MNKLVFPMRYFLIFTSCLFIFLGCKNSKNETDEIDTINFTYRGGMRIVYNELNISIENSYDGAIVFIQSNPLFDEPKWEYSKIDTFLRIDSTKFNNLAKSIINLEKIDANIAYLTGKDGYSCKIEFETKGKGESFNFWCPGSETEERGLTEFVKISNQLIEIAGLKDENLIR